jgi:hypothetical protein
VLTREAVQAIQRRFLGDAGSDEGDARGDEGAASAAAATTTPVETRAQAGEDAS